MEDSFFGSDVFRNGKNENKSMHSTIDDKTPNRLEISETEIECTPIEVTNFEIHKDLFEIDWESELEAKPTQLVEKREEKLFEFWKF